MNCLVSLIACYGLICVKIFYIILINSKRVYKTSARKFTHLLSREMYIRHRTMHNIFICVYCVKIADETKYKMTLILLLIYM